MQVVTSWCRGQKAAATGRPDMLYMCNIVTKPLQGFNSSAIRYPNPNSEEFTRLLDKRHANTYQDPCMAKGQAACYM